MFVKTEELIIIYFLNVHITPLDQKSQSNAKQCHIKYVSTQYLFSAGGVKMLLLFLASCEVT